MEECRILVLNGPNLNLLGTRDPEHYGLETLDSIVDRLKERASVRGAVITHFQSNHEGELIEALHEAAGWADGIIINPAAYTHYSYAIRDALQAAGLPAVEVHLSDISDREPWRRESVTEDLCISQISGKKGEGYLEALDLLLDHLAELP